ncbi:MAG: SDR family NAD(P)-dependent oxidoreductase [Spirochaetota bacterium]|nr:SDR family NAD(P)-dependent oxidoreductase [Spirochaetota bacterium]
MKIGIVTGASSGIGREFVYQLESAYELDELWLIARREDRLMETSARLQQAKGVVIPMDLTSVEEMNMLRRKIEDESPEICVLINNAGHGIIGAFEDISINDQLGMIDLNVNVLVRLTHICLSYMSEGSIIYQIASLNAFMPVPDGAVYSATKAFVLNFAFSLYQELKKKGIHVIAVSPGAVGTEWLEIASNGVMKAPPFAASASDVVRLAIRDAKKKKLNSTYGLRNKGNLILLRVLSKKFFFRLLSKV